MANTTSGVQVSESSHQNNKKEEPESESDDEDEDKVVETSPCGRWEKHKKELSQRNAPGIDSTYLAMDTEEGVEVVWNEVRFSERKSWKNKEEGFKRIFENLTQLDHPNIVKFHKYWVDEKSQEGLPRLIFIAEYMTSGSLRQFLKKTKPNIKSTSKSFNVKLKGWKRWCKQILSALRYLHSCDPPIVHGNLNCDTIFIQHNGLMKIGTVAPDAINNYVKTYKHQKRNMHFIAPEYDGESLFHALSDNTLNSVGNVGGSTNPQMVNCAADIYSFGMVALEMAAQWPEGTQSITSEIIEIAIENLEDVNQKDFIRKCIKGDNFLRPSVKELLLQPIMLEVYALKILAGHAFVDSYSLKKFEQMEERDPDRVMAVIKKDAMFMKDFKFSEVQPLELEKFLEEIKTGLYPLTGMEQTEAKKESRPTLNASRPKSPEDVANNSQGHEEEEKEVRLIIEMKCTVSASEDGSEKVLSLHLRLNDNMNRQLTRTVPESETGGDLADELVKYGLVSEHDREKVASKIDEYLLMPC